MHLLQMVVKCYIFSYCNQYSNASEDYMHSVFLPKYLVMLLKASPRAELIKKTTYIQRTVIIKRVKH